MKKKGFLYKMLPLMLAAVLCCFISSCGSDDDDSLDDNKNNGVVDKDDENSDAGDDDNDANGDTNNDVEFIDVLISEENFPDVKFRNYLLEQDYGKDGVITAEEIKNITEIYINGNNNYEKKVYSLRGIEYFTALRSLTCTFTILESLDVSKNTELEYLNLFWNEYLHSLDVSKNTALKYLDCSYNRLTSLDVSNNPALEYLSCYNNLLTSLDVSHAPALKTLNCCFNRLTSLDVSHAPALKTLDCSINQIKGEAMNALISSLPQNNTDEVYKFYVKMSSNTSEGNVFTNSHVEAVKAKGWTPYYYNTSSNNWKEY